MAGLRPQVLTMTFDFLVLVGLFGFKRSMPKPLFWIALIAGLGLFALCLTGHAAWWTGHLFYSLPPR
jgi:apolipoprotein N-acyltransferase